jgi:D-xylonolactonase
MPPATDPVCIADVKAILGEGPVWVAREEALYWVDIKGKRVFRLDAADGSVSSWQPPVRICSLAPRRGAGFVASTDRGFALVDPRTESFEFLGEVEAGTPGNRFNDGKVDRQGRFWAGTMDDVEEEATGNLYRLDPSFEWSFIDGGYKVTNGPAFSPDGRTLYHTDSARQTIYAFDLHIDGDARGKRVLAQFGEEHGYPDGMTVDAEGCLWVAFWDGWCVRRLSPEGEILQSIELPVQRPTSCAFGGPDFDRLYVTSASIGLDEKQLSMQPYAGGLFLMTPGVSGVPDTLFAG